MYAEGVQRVVIAQGVLHLDRSEVADDAGNDADDESAGRVHEAGRRGDGDETGYSARYDSQDGRLLGDQPLDEDPGQASRRGGNLRIDHGGAGKPVRRQFGTRIETEPADPEQGSADDRVDQIMRRHV